MPLPHWIWKPDRIGAIALANLVLVEICLLTLVLAPETIGNVLRSMAVIGLLILSFPLGWIGELLFGGFQTEPLHAFVSLPLNAYLWGGLLERYLQWRAEAQRVGLPDEGSGDSADGRGEED